MTQQWKLVPVEPTPQMVNAALKVSGIFPQYAAMLAVAPVPPLRGDQEVRKIVTEALVGMVSAVVSATPPPNAPLPDFIQAPVDRAVTRIGEHVSRLQAENAALQHFKTSYMEWHDKTELLLQGFEAGELGRHRADVLRSRFHRIQAENSALQRRLTIADQQVDDLQSELAKARELIARPAVKDCSWPSAVCECIHCESRLKP